MTTHEINPFVRYARKNETGFGGEYVARDNRIFFVKQGGGIISIDGVSKTIKKGDVIFWPSGTKYSVNLSENAEVSGCNFDFTQQFNNLKTPIAPTKFGAPTKDVLERFNWIDCALFKKMFVLNNAFSLESKFDKIAEEYDGKRVYFLQKCSAILKDILISCVRMSEIDRESKTTALAQNVLEYMRQNYAKKITNDSIAKHFNYHPNYLNKLVLQHTGKSMHKYLSQYRVSIAIELLQGGNMTVSEIAAAVGVPDIKHFSKLFKSTTGTSPTVMKK